MVPNPRREQSCPACAGRFLPFSSGFALCAGCRTLIDQQRQPITGYRLIKIRRGLEPYGR